MTDVVTALAPIMPIITDIAVTILSGVAVFAVKEVVSIAQHWFHISASTALEQSLETAASNAAAGIVAKSSTNVINEVFSINDPRVQSAAKWIVNESVQHAAAVHYLAANVDDMAHKIVSKLGAAQVQMTSAPAVPTIMAK